MRTTAVTVTNQDCMFNLSTFSSVYLKYYYSPLLFLPQALEAHKTAQLKRCFFDWADYLKSNPAGNTPYTPSLPLLYGTK